MASEFILSNNGKLKPTDANSAAGNNILITGGDSDNNDLAGGNITLEGGRGQGIGNGGSIIFKTASPGKSSSSTLGSLTERMIVYMDGNVGIGTTVPSANLHIQHNSADDYSNLGLKIHNGVSEYTLVNNNSDNLVFSNNSNPRVTFTNDGKVGIGTTSPGTQLQLESTAPYLTLKNSTSENTDGGCESKIIFKDHDDKTLAQIQASHDGTADDQKGDLIFYTNDGNDDNSPTEQMRIESSGNIGIGTNSPKSKLQIKQDIANNPSSTGPTVDSYGQLEISSISNVTGGHSNAAPMNITIGAWNGTNPCGYIQTIEDNVHVRNLSLQPRSGYVGIGTTSPNTKLHVAGNRFYDGGWISSWSNADDDAFDGGYSGNAYVSIYGQSAIAAPQFLVESDSRIKKDIELVSDTEALNLVNALESKKYFYKDPIKQTENKIIGFLAQDVKEVFPSAVKNNTGFIPDELREIPASNFNGTTLTVDNIVWEESHNGNCRFFVSDDDEGTNEEMIDLVCNKDENDNYNGEFTFEKTWNKIIFYGKEITDFQIIDKPQIFALHHSAIQELSRQLDAEKAKTATLETQVADLLARVTALENP